MENIIDRAGNVMVTMPAFPQLRARWCSLPRTQGVVAQAPVSARDQATTMPAAGTYRVADLRSITDGDIRIVFAGADHKFSTRLGPTSSPPV